MDCPKCKKPGCAEDPAGGYWCQNPICQHVWHPAIKGSLEKVMGLVEELRKLAVSQPRDFSGASAGCAFLIAAEMIEKEFGLESPPDPSISDGFDDWP